MAVTTNVGVERLFDALDRLSSPQQTTNAAGFQASKVAGHPSRGDNPVKSPACGRFT